MSSTAAETGWKIDMEAAMRAYGEREHKGKYVLEDYAWSRNHHRAVTIRRWKRHLKRKARKNNRLRQEDCME